MSPSNPVSRAAHDSAKPEPLQASYHYPKDWPYRANPHDQTHHHQAAPDQPYRIKNLEQENCLLRKLNGIRPLSNEPTAAPSPEGICRSTSYPWIEPIFSASPITSPGQA